MQATSIDNYLANCGDEQLREMIQELLEELEERYPPYHPEISFQDDENITTETESVSSIISPNLEDSEEKVSPQFINTFSDSSEENLSTATNYFTLPARTTEVEADTTASNTPSVDDIFLQAATPIIGETFRAEISLAFTEYGCCS